MGKALLLLTLLSSISYAQEQCSKEETLKNLRKYILKYHLWKDRFSEVPEWKDETEAIVFLRSQGDRWTIITKPIEEEEEQEGPFVMKAVEKKEIMNLGDKKMGYVHLVSFTPSAVKEFKKAMKEFERKGIDGLIIDLRDNRGGLVDAAKGIADMLIGGNGVMFYLEGNSKRLKTYKFKSEESFNKPIFVVVNENTASSAEILTSLLKRYANATIAGERTMGKNVGNIVYQLDECGTLLWLMSFTMKFPDGTLVVKQGGLEPDCHAEGGSLEKALECFKRAMSSEVFKRATGPEVFKRSTSPEFLGMSPW